MAIVREVTIKQWPITTHRKATWQVVVAVSEMVVVNLVEIHNSQERPMVAQELAGKLLIQLENPEQQALTSAKHQLTHQCPRQSHRRNATLR